MKTLNSLNFNFETTENTIKTIGSILILITGILLTISEAVNPTNFTL